MVPPCPVSPGELGNLLPRGTANGQAASESLAICIAGRSMRGGWLPWRGGTCGSGRKADHLTAGGHVSCSTAEHPSPCDCREVEEGRLAATVWRDLRNRAARDAKNNVDGPATVSERPVTFLALDVSSANHRICRCKACPRRSRLQGSAVLGEHTHFASAMCRSTAAHITDIPSWLSTSAHSA